MQDLDDIFEALNRSPFRRRFHLRGPERAYLDRKGMETVLAHGADFIAKRLAPAAPPNDGRQTPMGNHPVFVAQHATGTCCRGCLEKWHAIPKGHPLTDAEQQYILTVIARWLRSTSARPSSPRAEYGRSGGRRDPERKG